ncbi:MAG: thioredoxin [Pseudomonadota bacterium]
MAIEYTVFVKEACETCQLVIPVLRQLCDRLEVELLCQDNPAFPPGLTVVDDTALARSYAAGIEIVPTVIRNSDGERVEGWDRSAWEHLLGFSVDADIVPFRPGCGSKTLDPGMPEKLAAKYGSHRLKARRIELASEEDDMEACFDRGWSDGLPLVPPTELRVVRMLTGTRRDPGEVVGNVPPDYAPCTIEKIAINAVMAGCKPEYLPVVIAAVEAALQDAFCMHGLLATTYFSGPMIVVNGPLSRAIGMNSRGNALGQGNRANATIGRALQLVIRNVGGGKPGGVDRAALGNPGKYTFCFAEDETNSCWESLSVERGYSPAVSTVTLFAADGVQGIVDQKSRTPDSLCRSFAAGLRVASHPKMVMAADAFLVISPEHERVFRLAGWSKAQVKERLTELLQIPGAELVRGAGGIEEGLPEKFASSVLPKFREGGLNIVRAGGSAGLFSAIIAGWGASGSTGSIPVTWEIKP